MEQKFKCKSFAERDASIFLGELEISLVNEIREVARETILYADEDEFKQGLVEKYSIEPLSIVGDKPSIEQRTEVRTVDDHGISTTEVNVFRVSYSFTGSPGLFRLRPNTYYSCWHEIIVDRTRGLVSFEFDFRSMNVEEFNQKLQRHFNEAFGSLNGVNNQVAAWNRELASKVNSVFNPRKAKLVAESKFFEAINVTISPVANAIFPVPLIKKKIIPQPASMRKGQSSDPTFPEDIYRDVLALMFSAGKRMEQKPSLYVGKSEESLRDLFLLFLETRYDGTTATGETFNRSGKTDILLRYAETNLFVAECKFWTGPAGLHDAIHQLFERYLTWRDSKTALLIFVQNRDFTKVLQTIELEAQGNKYYSRFIKKAEETSFTFEFHLPQDKEKRVMFEILAFHFDKGA